MNVLALKEMAEDCHTATALAYVEEVVAKAAQVVAPVWPLQRFIAVNPLQGLEDLSFEEAVTESWRCRSAQPASGREVVNRELIKWCTAFFDTGQASLKMPDRQLGFYGAFAALAPYDRKLQAHPGASQLLTELPSNPEQAILQSLHRLQVPVPAHTDFIRRGLAALPGWAGYVVWLQHWKNPLDTLPSTATLLEFVAVRLVLTSVLWPQAVQEDLPDNAPATEDVLKPIWEAEERVSQSLLQELDSASAKLEETAQCADAQLVFCIDVRSESFRRAIELQGNYQTFGFAGFFGLPVRLTSYGAEHAHDSCPVLLKPRHEICTRPTGESQSKIQRYNLGRALLNAPTGIYKWLKYNFVTPFALVEMLGPWSGVRMVLKTFVPSHYAKLTGFTQQRVMPRLATAPDLSGVGLLQQADYGESALRLMGLTHNFAPLVVLCGHGSTTTNNAYAAALDCGACGGAHGGINAQLLAAILNDPDVRAILEIRGLPIPAKTQFLAAEHNTTTDQVHLFNGPKANAEQRLRIALLKADLDEAGEQAAQLRTERAGSPVQLPTKRSQRQALRRSSDWAETRPEWGLARNAAFIVGPRSLTQKIDLQGRCFLHSYDWEADHEGAHLTTILIAPMVVAQWINCQYLFSTLDNVTYGAGSKVTKNVVGKLGVMQGNASDLMHGLPLQSVFATDDMPYHEPARLSTVVYAPRQRVKEIIEAQPVLQKLFHNGWVHLIVLDPIDQQTYRFAREGSWLTVQ